MGGSDRRGNKKVQGNETAAAAAATTTTTTTIASTTTAAGAATATPADWEAICPDLFLLILTAVQENAWKEASEARRVVAMAGVCRRWRRLIQQSYVADLHLGLLQFPFALIQPGPSTHRPLQCLLKRAGPNLFLLFQQNFHTDQQQQQQQLQQHRLDFLMAAQRSPPWKSSFCISASPRCFSPHSHAFMGKLKWDFWAEEFSLWEAFGRACYNFSQQQIDRRGRRLALKVRFFDRNLVAGNDPHSNHRLRGMLCELFNPGERCSSRRITPPPSSPKQRYGAGLQRWACFNPSVTGFPPTPVPPRASAKAPAIAVKRSTFLRSYSSLRRSDSAAANLERSLSKGKSLKRSKDPFRTPQSILMENQAPDWDEHRQCWSLDFRGRASLPSHNSFQLVRKNSIAISQKANPAATHQEEAVENAVTHQGGADAQTSTQGGGGEETIVLLQLGKVGQGLYTVDFCHPLSAFQAFSICLSSFATNVGLQP